MTLRPSHPLAPRLSVGACAYGKTYLLQTEAARISRRVQVVGLDVAGDDWPGAPLKGHRYALATGPEGARSALAKGHRLVVVRPGLRVPDFATLAEELAGACIEAPGPCVLVAPEAHVFAPKRWTPTSNVGLLLTQFRHARVKAGIWGDTQFFRKLSEHFIDACHAIYVFSAGAKGDAERLRQSWGREFLRAAEEAGRRNEAANKAGRPTDKGWHVAVNPNAPARAFEPVKL